MGGFHLFSSFPPEIHSLILSSCPPNDRTCLSLTCKYLYSLSLPLKTPASLLNIDEPLHLCAHYQVLPGLNERWSYRLNHRRACHDQCHTELAKRYERQGLPPPKLRRCATRQYSTHCECFQRKSALYQRLSGWTPRGLNYCQYCKKFTRRKPQHKGRCFHGYGKPPVREETFWTHHPRRGAFGGKLWKKWFNNRAMNSLELRLSREGGQIRSNRRYDLRFIPPKQVCTRTMRGV